MNRSPFPPGSHVAAYFRDSGGDTQELSIQQQEAAFRAWCAEHGLIPGQVFTDAARPGSSVVSRTGFQDMMHHFRTGAPEAGLVIWSYSRFARDFDDAQFYRADLRRRGYIFHSMNDEIPDGPIGRFFEAAIDWKNEQFLEDLSRDVKRGLHDLVQRYGAMPGTPPRGFMRQPITIGRRRDGRDHVAHRWAPDPEKIPLVRQAFAMLLDGRSLIEIQNSTHLYGSINSWTTFFRNKIYMGTLEFGSLTIENYCEPIVDEQTWAAAQAVIARRARRAHLSGDNPHHPRRNGDIYILSGLVYCAQCGSPLFGSSERARRPGGYDYRYERYVCSRRYRNRDCQAEGIPRIYLDDLVKNTVIEYILSPQNLASRQAILLQSESQRQAELDAQAAVLRSQLGAARRRIANITETLAEQGSSRALLAKLVDLEAHESTLLSDMAQIEARSKMAVEPQTSLQIDAMSQRLVTHLQNSSGQACRRILRGLLHRVVVEREDQVVRIQFDYFYPPEEKPPPGDDIILLSPVPLGALGHRYTFTHTITVPFQRKKRGIQAK